MLSVLYVDDEDSLLELGKVFLEESGDFRVDLLPSAIAALEHLKTHRYDAIISDYQMPEMDGLEFLRHVRKEYGQVPFILFTGRGREEVVILALNDGADFYLQKGGAPQPQFAELAHKIRLAVQRRQSVLALEESERRYRDVVETQTEFICRFLPDGTYVFANEAYCRFFHQKRDEIIGHRFMPNILPEDKPRLDTHFRSLSASHPSRDIEHRVIMPDGSIRWQWWSDHALFDEKGTIVEYQSVGKDITEKKEAEQALKISENLYRTVFNTTGAATIIIEKDTTIVLANPEFARLSGYSSEELEGRHSWTEFVVKEDLERMKKYHQDRRAVDGFAPRVYEFRFISRTGEVRHCINYVAMIPGTSRSVASVVNIHDRVLAEQDYRSIFENIQDVFYRTDAEGRLILASPSGAKILGYDSIEEIYGKDIALSLYEKPEDRQKFLQEIEQKGQVSNFEVRIKRKDGTPMTILASSHKYYDASGTFRGIEGILRDITDRKDVAEELKASETLYRAIFDYTLAATCIIGPDTTLLHVNDSWERLTGYTRSEAENAMSWTTFIHTEDVQRLREYHVERRHNPGNVPTKYECRIRDKQGTIHYCLTYVDMIPGTRNSIASLVDISERKRAEEDLKQSESLYRAIFENTGAATIIIAPDTTILLANAGWIKLTGVPREEQETMLSWTRFIDKEDVERMKHYHQLRRKDPSLAPTVYECHVINQADSTIHNCVVHVDMIPGTKNSVASLVDFTERRKAEDDLRLAYEQLTAAEEELRAQFDELKYSQDKIRESENNFRSILENIQDVYYRTDAEGNLIFASPSLATVTGYSPVENLYGKSIAQSLYANPDDRKTFLSDLEKNGSVTNYEVVLKKDDGTLITVITSSHKYFDSNGHFLGVEGIFRDISDRKRMEDAIRKSEQNYRSVIENLQDAFYRTDKEGNIILVSPSFALELGYDSVDEVMGKNVARDLYLNPLDREGFLAALHMSGEIKDYRVVLRKKDGRPLPVLATSHIYFDEKNTPAGIEGLLHIIRDTDIQ
ncbi:MAG: PAS domain S-box protein [Methanomicrobiales archaeon]|nr:PAS domain S-box protein [Methanomicrobiales archaeon]